MNNKKYDVFLQDIVNLLENEKFNIEQKAELKNHINLILENKF